MEITNTDNILWLGSMRLAPLRPQEELAHRQYRRPQHVGPSTARHRPHRASAAGCRAPLGPDRRVSSPGLDHLGHRRPRVSRCDVRPVAVRGRSRARRTGPGGRRPDGEARVLRVLLGLLERAGHPARGSTHGACGRRSRARPLHERRLRGHRRRGQARPPGMGSRGRAAARRHPEPSGRLPRLRGGRLAFGDRNTSTEGRLRPADGGLRPPEPAARTANRNGCPHRRARRDDRADRARKHRRLHRRAQHRRRRRDPPGRGTTGRVWRRCCADTTSC